MTINAATLERALEMLGQILAEKDCYYEVVAIGGGSLLLLGQIVRTTKDLDLVAIIEESELVTASPLPEQLIQARDEVAVILSLGKDWLNPGPTSLLNFGLPKGFEQRMQARHFGGLTVHLASRFDQICFKLYAAIDHGPKSKHFADLQLLQPTPQELDQAKEWCKTHDPSESFAVMLDEAAGALNA